MKMQQLYELLPLLTPMQESYMNLYQLTFPQWHCSAEQGSLEENWNAAAIDSGVWKGHSSTIKLLLSSISFTTRDKI